MADQQGTLQTIGSILATALQPLITAFSSTEAFKGFMLRLGWSPLDLPPAYSNLANLVSAVVDKVENLGDNPSPSDIADLVQKGVAAFGAIQSISTAPPGVDAGAFLAEIGERLVLVEGTVANHVAPIMRRLGLRSRAQIAVWAVERGLYRSGDEAE